MEDRNYSLAGGDAGRTASRPDGTPPSDAEVRWETPIEPDAQPLVLDGGVYTTVREFDDTDLVGYRLDDGSGTFRLDLPDDYRIRGFGADSRRLYAATGEGVAAFDPRTERTEWSVELDAATQRLAVDGSDVYVVNPGSNVRDDLVVRIATFPDGNQSYSRGIVYEVESNAGVPRPSELAVADGSAFVSVRGTLIRYDGRESVWEATLDQSGPAESLVVHDRSLYCSVGGSGSQPSLRAYDAATGTTAWETRLGESASAIAAVGETVLAVVGDIAVGAAGVAAFDATDGTRQWEAFDLTPTSPLSVVGETVFVGTEEATGTSLTALDLADGTESWHVDVPTRVEYHPVVLDDGIVVGGDSLVCLDPVVETTADAPTRTRATGASGDESGQCPSCGAAVSSDEAFCADCGTKLPDETCPECEEPLDGDEAFCPQCGHDLDDSDPACPDCGADIDGDEAFCPQCGHSLD
ncbi:outer membrane protein assembly factor BamB family protein [Halorussus salinus]|uniref:outer membrane protein assembly factor BamB family protein n=1 Tax=Halorussus salinus TaxID=1364935 RepID=UPI001092B3E4|nr:PQQ-binding-like beta-propeller repeat protein [Halorussus salinus]